MYLVSVERLLLQSEAIAFPPDAGMPRADDGLLLQSEAIAFPPDAGMPRADDEPLLQSEAIAIVQDLLPESGHILYDAGNCAAAALHMTRVPSGASSTIALGMGGMGYAIAGAIGAQLGSPRGTRTVVFAGDGAFLMTGLEIHTAVDLGLPILFVVFNNNMHGMCVTRQQLLFESRLECVRYAPVNIALLARGLGALHRLWVGSASTVDELCHQLEDYRNHTDRPGVLELRLLREEMPPFTPFLPESVPTMPIGKEESKELTYTKLRINVPVRLPSFVSFVLSSDEKSLMYDVIVVGALSKRN
jgi:acetolactate synthase-1/2/3 large subunit